MIKEALLRATLLRERLRLLRTKQDLYDRIRDPEEIAARQLAAFNTMWAKAISRNAFYREWRRRHGLPTALSSLRELATFPALTKEEIRTGRDLVFRDLPPHRVVSTGGSQGTPTPFPTCGPEKDWEYANTYLGKSWWGVAPLDPILMYWGHSHLFGVGPVKRVNRAKRDLGDWLINTRRENAYDMTPETLSRYLERLKGEAPRAIIGYTSCLYQLAKYSLEKGVHLGGNDRLKAVIPTSETVTDLDVEIIGKAFGAPVVIEYGMAETGVIAYSHPSSSRLRIFWDSFIVQTDEAGDLHITTLNDRLFPLVRYQTGDVAETLNIVGGSALELGRVRGRAKESVAVAAAGGARLNLSGILLVHILKGFPGILGINFRQLPEGRVQIRLTAAATLDLDAVRTHFLGHLRRDHPGADSEAFDLVQVGAMEKTVAGKEKLLC